MALIGLVGLMATACGSAADAVEETSGASATVASTTSDVPASTTSTSAVEPEESEEVATTVEPPEFQGDLISHPALGGLRLTVPGSTRVFSEGDYVSLLLPEGSARVVVARVSAAITGDPIATMDDFIGAAMGLAGATVVATGDTMDVLGQSLTVHRFSDAVFEGAPGLFPARPLGYGSNVFWLPGPVAELGLANVEGGVLAVGVTAAAEAELDAASDALESVVESLELLSESGTIQPLPTAAVVPVVGASAPFTPAASVADASVLAQPFTPVEPGRYQLANIPSAPVAELGPGWFVAPNFPGFVVLLELPLVGPGYRDIVFLEGPNQISGASLGPTPNGEPVALGSAMDLISAALPNLIVEGVQEEVQVGELTATRFDLRIDSSATCQEGSPCSFVIGSPNPEYAKFVTPGVVHRGWWIDVPNGDPLLIMAAAAENDAAWLEETADALVTSLELTSR